MLLLLLMMMVMATYVCVCSVGMCEGKRIVFEVIPQRQSTFFLRQGLSLVLSLSIG